MRRLLVVVCCLTLTAAVLVLAQNDRARQQGRRDVYFGFLVGSPRVAGVAFDLSPPDKSGVRTLRGYVCDGLGVPDGIAVWFLGPVQPETVSRENPFILKSVGGQHTLRLTAITDRGVYGAFTEPSGDRAAFVSYPSIDGAGIYQVTLESDLHYTGTSTDGAVLDAQATTDGTTTGTIKPAGGPEISFSVRSLALASPAELTDHGLPVNYLDYTAHNQIPGSYVAVIAPGGSHWFGRSGSVRLGSPGLEIIGLDKKEVRRR